MIYEYHIFLTKQIKKSYILTNEKLNNLQDKYSII